MYIRRPRFCTQTQCNVKSIQQMRNSGSGAGSRKKEKNINFHSPLHIASELFTIFARLITAKKSASVGSRIQPSDATWEEVFTPIIAAPATVALHTYSRSRFISFSFKSYARSTFLVGITCCDITTVFPYPWPCFQFRCRSLIEYFISFSGTCRAFVVLRVFVQHNKAGKRLTSVPRASVIMFGMLKSKLAQSFPRAQRKKF